MKIESVFLTGGTGFVGTELLKKLLKKDVTIYLLVHNDKSLDVDDEKIVKVRGDVLEPYTYEEVLTKVDCIINLVGIIREYPDKGITFEKLHYEATVKLVDCAKRYGVKRFIQMSANGAREDAVTNYHKTKFAAEEYVANSGLTYTIFKPSVIYGEKDSFINMLAGYIKRTPVFSYFGRGDYLLQPVYVKDVAKIFAECMDKEETFNKKYTICGKDTISYKNLLKLISEVLNKRVIFFPIPELFVMIAITLFGSFNWFPLTKDQFIMLKEGNTCSSREIFYILKIEDRDLKVTIASYLPDNI